MQIKIPDYLIKRGIQQIVTLDFETFYSTDYTLRKMSTSLYIFDDQFKVHGVGININEVTTYYYHCDVKEALDKIDWSISALLAHHTHFDGLILKRHYGHTPKYFLDTLSMARPLYQNKVKKLDLDSLAQFIGIKGKLSGLEDTKGKRDLTPKEAVRLGIYCKNDVDITIPVFNNMLSETPEMEMHVIDLTVRMYADPVLIVDEWLINIEVDHIRKEKQKMFTRVHNIFPPELQKESTLKVLRSAAKLAEVMIYNGVVPPKKVSERTGKETYAFAKSDLNFQKLKSHGSKEAQLLHDARIVSTSDTALNKGLMLQKFANNKCCPVYLNYWRAQTGRWSGGDKIQLQNLPRGGAARLSILAPEDHILLVSDLSQIELRMSAWFAEQQDILDIFASGKDVYKDMAAKIYNVAYAAVTKSQRMVAKVTCFGGDTHVLCNSGWKPINQITKQDTVYNGKKFVRHGGIINKGIRKTINRNGISITPDHLIHTDALTTVPYSTCISDTPMIKSAYSYAKSKLRDCNLKKATYRNDPTCTFEEDSFMEVFDILDVEDTNSYMIRTTRGPLLVSNCLGLGYGCGVPTFDAMLKAGAMGPKVDLPLDEVTKIHAVYRQANNKIVQAWKKAGEWLLCMCENTSLKPMEYKGLRFEKSKAILPGNIVLHYPNMYIDDYGQITYSGSNGITRRIYSSLFYENIIQALSRNVIAEQMLNMGKYYRIVLSVHDEAVLSVPFLEVNKATDTVLSIMRTAPSWCHDLPLDAEAGYDINYSK